MGIYIYCRNSEELGSNFFQIKKSYGICLCRERAVFMYVDERYKTEVDDKNAVLSEISIYYEACQPQ